MARLELYTAQTGTTWELTLDAARRHVTLTRRPIERNKPGAIANVLDEVLASDAAFADAYQRAFATMLDEGALRDDNNRELARPIPLDKLLRRAEVAAPVPVERVAAIDKVRALLDGVRPKRGSKQRAPDRLRERFHYVIAIDAEEVAPGARLRLGASRVGGRPDLPRRFKWPERDGVPLSFFAQLELAALARFDLERRLPGKGWLVHFIDETGYGRVFFIPPGAKLAPATKAAPAAAPAYSLEFAPGFTFELLDTAEDIERALGPRLVAQIAEALGNGARPVGFASDRVFGAPMDMQAVGVGLFVDPDDDDAPVADDYTVLFQFEHGEGYVLVGVPDDDLRDGNFKDARAIFTGT